MTLLRPQLALRRLEVFHKGRPVYSQPFHDGVNIIRGSNSSGKSTIADFIFFALGGDLAKWKPEAELCDFVIAEVEINGAIVTLKRDISTSSRQPLAIFWGPLDKARTSVAEGWQVFPFSRGEDRESFSQVLFRALELPEVRGDADSNITMHQLLRLIYIDQISGVDSLMRDERFDAALTRNTIGDLLFGIYEDSLYQEELLIRAKQKELEESTREFDTILSVLGQSGIEVDALAIQKALTALTEQEAELQTGINAILNDHAKGASPDSLTTAEKAREVFKQMRQAAVRLEDARDRQALEVEDSRHFVRHLEARLNSLSDSEDTRAAIKGLPVTACPECLAPVAPSTDTTVCALCKKPTSAEIQRSQLMRMRQELALQLKESQKLLGDKETRLSELSGELPLIREKARAAEKTLRELVSDVKSPRDQRLDDLFTKKGAFQSQREFLIKQAKAVRLLETLKQKCSKLKAEVQSLALSIKTKKSRQDKRRAEAGDTIAGYTLALLSRDLPREDTFKAPKSLAIDFNKNSFAVDGRNWFSASAMTYLKNSVHFGIFFASLGLPYFRYPRFLLCDNVEDKGMEESRSRNFQKLIVEFSKKFAVRHQIIFTTSMIDPSLNIPELCVGPQYSEGHKSLEFENNPGQAAT